VVLHVALAGVPPGQGLKQFGELALAFVLSSLLGKKLQHSPSFFPSGRHASAHRKPETDGIGVSGLTGSPSGGSFWL
jgi:hypothetical protein